ncbi:lectin like domain-containing protein [Ruminococcus sp. Marseille-P6503]|uniref:lectin like domain-containing protein n=1 Tax=Ruminococcus sp. Marseille-P6503 TaxID=2364796 RepID=UPI0013DE6799|nr:lectin like domain-containing protein [Ruminococcus sp. Marseille-P6503]
MKIYFRRTASALISAVVLASSVSLSAFAQENDRQDLFAITDVVYGSSSEYGYKPVYIGEADGNAADNEEYGVNAVKLPSLKADMSSLPESYDIRENGFDTYTRNQGDDGACWAFSTIAAAESWAVMNGYENGDVDFSEAHLAWFALNPNSGEGTDGTNISDPFDSGGNWLISSAALSCWSGVEYEDYAPFPVYSTSEYQLPEELRYASRYKLKNINLYQPDDTEAIKNAVMNYGGVQVAYYSNSDYYSSDGISYYYNGSNTTNHSVFIAGWDDNYSRENFGSVKPSSDGAWLIRGSWGDYGDNGYYWISYEDTSLDSFASYEFYPAEETDNNYTYSTSGMESYLNSSEEIYQANVFTAEGSELLKAVSFYTYQTNGNESVEYRVDIYKGAEFGADSPISGSPQASVSGSVDFNGYHTVELDSEVELSAGDTFSVVLRLYQQGGSANAACEGRASYMTSKSGESYFSTNGVSWYKNQEIPSSSGTSNVNNNCINAYTVDMDQPDKTALRALADEYSGDPSLSFEVREVMAALADAGASKSDVLNASAHMLAAVNTGDSVLHISSAEQWNTFADSVNSGNGYEGKIVKLSADIDFSGCEFVPAGTQSCPFDGIFDGQGYIMSGISCNADYSGVFGRISKKSAVKNLVVTDSEFSGKYAAGICAMLDYGTIKNCGFNGTVSADQYGGGVAAYMNGGNIISSYGCTDSNTPSAVSGIVKYVRSESAAERIYNCVYSGNTADSLGTQSQSFYETAEKLNTFNNTQTDSESWGVRASAAVRNTPEGISYAVTFKAQVSGSPYENTVYTDIYGSAVFPSVDLPSGCTLKWTLDGQEISQDQRFSSDCEVTGIIESTSGDRYTVSYVLDGGANSADNPSEVNAGESYVLSPASKAHAEFGGWYLDAGFTNKVTALEYDSMSEDVILYAKWIPDTFTVRFVDINGGIISSQTVEYGKPAFAPEAPDVDDKLFTGWSADFSSITADLTVRALYKNYISIAKASVSGISGKTYTGGSLTQSLRVTCNSAELIQGRDYTVSYKNNINAGTAELTITGTGDYYASVTRSFTIARLSSSALTVSFSDADRIYTGKDINPAVTVKHGSKTLVKNSDYTVSYQNCTAIGKATVKIIFKGNYTGAVTKSFNIVPKTPVVKASYSATSDAVRINWNKVDNCTGYRIYRYNSSTKKWVNIKTIGNSSTITYRDSGLKSGTQYKYKVKAYKKIDGVVYWGSASAVKNTATNPSAVSITSSSRTSSAIRINWNKTACDGYQVYRYDSSSKAYVRIATVSGSSVLTYKQTGLKKNTTYKYKVRAFKKDASGGYRYSSFSSVKSVTTKK